MKLHESLCSILIVAALSCCFDATTKAQVATDNEACIHNGNGSTSSISGARYEILRDWTDGRPCFKIDKQTGKVWKLVYSLGINAKYYLCGKDSSDDDVAFDDKINYQLVVDSSTHAILMNLNTGELWEYTEGLIDKAKFKLMTER